MQGGCLYTGGYNRDYLSGTACTTTYTLYGYMYVVRISRYTTVVYLGSLPIVILCGSLTCTKYVYHSGILVSGSFPFYH